MSAPLQIVINHVVHQADGSREIIVKERDNVCFLITVPSGSDAPVLFVEDFSVGLIQTFSRDGLDTYESKDGPIFREVFGIAIVRLKIVELEITQVFNVLLNKLAIMLSI